MIKYRFLIIALSIFLTGAFVAPVFGYVAESTNFRLQQDSVNFGGGWGESDNFTEEDSLGEIATGWSYSDNFSLHAGYQQMEESYISLSAPDSTTLLPSIPGLSGGSASGTAPVVVTTDNSAGYTLQLKASTAPALQSTTSFFSNYSLASSYPDYDWSVANTTSEFGFTPEGVDVYSRYLDSAGVCNSPSGSDGPDHCWDRITMSDQTISQSAVPNHPAGTTTTVKVKAQSGSDHIQPSGTYHAAITITAYVN